MNTNPPAKTHSPSADLRTLPGVRAAAEELARLGRALGEEGLTWGTSGNLSLRLDDEWMLASATGTWARRLMPEDFVPVRLADGTHWGERRPTKEVPMHAAIYRAQPSARCVLHGSPPHCTWLACTDLVADFDGLFIETMHYLQAVAVAPYAHPGTPELGEVIGAAAATGAHAILMRNHGAIVWHTGGDEALMAFLSLEFAARVVHLGHAAGHLPRPLPPAVAAEFRARRVYRK